MKDTTRTAAHVEAYLLLAMFAGGLLLVFVLASGTSGANVDRAPQPLPTFVDRSAEPMPGAMPEVDAEQPSGEPSVDRVLLVWTALDHQRREEWEIALDHWRGVQLADDAEAWRYVAIAQAHLALGQYDETAEALDTAEKIEPDNAVVHYFRGLLRLEQVPHAYDWYDAVEPGPTRLAAYVPTDVIPNSRAMYRYDARMELEKAIDLAGDVRLDQPLTPAHWRSTMALGPTVGDLLLATGADNFQARAHNILGGLLLEEGALDKAEYHIDRAAKAGMFVSFNYVDLIEEYEGRGYYLDAARVCAKAVGHGMDEEAARARAAANLQASFGW